MRRRALLLLTMMALTVAVASGTATAETQNGPIYYGCNGVCSIDPPVSTQPSVVTTEGNLFDVARDRETLVYQRSGFSNNDLGPFYTVPLSGAPYYYEGGTEVQISNLSASLEDMTMPRFSPDGKTIYFRGKHVVDPPDGADPRLYEVHAIYSVPTEGGEATRIPIDWVNEDGTPRHIGSFELSHDGSKFAINGPFGIFTVPVSGGVPTRVNRDSCGGAQYPSFSPDDQVIVYTSNIWSGDNCSGTAERTVYTTPADNDGTRPGTALFPEDATDPNIYDSKRWPTYSPDGKYIAFTYWRSGGSSQLATAPATGGAIRNVAGCVMCVPLWIEKPLDTSITSITSRPSGASTTTSVAFSSNDDEATFQCKLDDGAFEVCASPKEYPGLAEGSSHTVEVRAVNPAGVADPTPATRTWTVDITAPTVIGVSPTDGAKGVALNTKVEATFSEEMEAATVFSNFTLTKQGSSESVAWSSMGYSSVTKKADLDPTSNLELNTTYAATIKGGSTGVKDIMGNALAQDYSWTFTTTADTTVPDTTIDSGPSGTVSSTTASFSFSSNESDVTFECKLDNGAFESCSSPKSVPNEGLLAQGSHTFQVRAIDKAGNTDATPATRSWFVDTVVPKGTISINSGASTTASRSVTLRLSASDPSPASGVASMRFRNESTTTWSEWFDYSTSAGWTLTAGAGTKTVYVQYKDRAGNVSATASDTIRFRP